MKDASQYPVTFPYGATTAPYSPNKPHTGDDRACPIGTPLPVNRQVIALTGTTGNSTGPHLHTQLVRGGAVANPKGGGFTMPSPVIVTEVGEKPDIGKYVRVKDGNSDIWSYFHLDEILVKVGDQIGDAMTEELARSISKWARLMQHLSEKDAADYAVPDVPYLMANPDKVGEFLEGLYRSPEWQNANYKVVHYGEGSADAPKFKKVLTAGTDLYVAEDKPM